MGLSDSNGAVCCAQQATKGVDGAIKFLQMNPAVHFEEIVAKARSVILAGGTMQPVR